MNHLKRPPIIGSTTPPTVVPTSLRMVAKFYGMDYSAEMLRKHCHISRRGVNKIDAPMIRYRSYLK